ncbi:MAG: MarR family winged helix-turn-helix transcriptional regulator [Rectinemataceae bacterium]
MQEKSFDTKVMNFMMAAGLLKRRMRSAIASNDLSWAQMTVLARLGKDGPSTTADLARAERMKPQSMRTIILALEGMGLVERKPHQTDGRQIIIKLTAKGTAVRKIASDEQWTWLVQAITRLDKEEQKTLFAAGEIIKRLVEK